VASGFGDDPDGDPALAAVPASADVIESAPNAVPPLSPGW